ncbi:hypothetical protein CSOJ01_12379 [Colletotrichum sojae]|uniref:Uncharacterized protein n=1 Tax=Colletotrichum sojae TaxID=2175907 RepID=A0A8H6MMN5_9PEZI|nr:hypothetical protein CSOJ01_12379 [Colletotrichum sojae]
MRRKEKNRRQAGPSEEPRGVEGQDKRHRQGVVLVLVLVPSSANCRNVAVIQQQMGSQAANFASQKSVPVEAAVDESLMLFKALNGRVNRTMGTTQPHAAQAAAQRSGGRVGWQRPIGRPRPKMAHMKGSRASPPRLVFSLGASQPFGYAASPFINRAGITRAVYWTGWFWERSAPSTAPLTVILVPGFFSQEGLAPMDPSPTVYQSRGSWNSTPRYPYPIANRTSHSDGALEAGAA